ncbi:hypothetical protein HMPREF0849_01605 [Streptococcus sp. C300]|uniref:hypothetical protein n=1 Tax=Streptococcus sp. C300 TaxID=563036 RepID=UPI0001F8995B|nr:hypothetical protein [Streptococcus sp. C300]EFX56200.1 hypothetical protein HMPREF0849_01605 [Streptococcus sp. C300]
MKQYRKKILIILGVLSLLVVTGSCFFLLLKPSQPPKELEYRMRTAMGKSDFQLFGDKNQYVLAPSNKGSLFVSKTYAITDEYKTFIVEDEKKLHTLPHLQMEGEYRNLILYNLDEEGLPERKIDLFQAVRSYNQKSVPTRLIGSYYVGDTHYFGLEIVDLTDEENRSYKTVYLNLETEEVVDLPKDTKFGRDSDISATARITNFNKVIDSKGYIGPLNEIVTTRSEGQVPDPNINLYSLYPDIEDKLINQNWSLYVRTDKVTPDECFDTLLHWFAPKGEDLLTVYGRNDDGEASDVQIRNSQEANAWLEQHPALRNIDYYRPDGSDKE